MVTFSFPSFCPWQFGHRWVFVVKQSKNSSVLLPLLISQVKRENHSDVKINSKNAHIHFQIKSLACSSSSSFSLLFFTSYSHPFSQTQGLEKAQADLISCTLQLWAKQRCFLIPENLHWFGLFTPFFSPRLNSKVHHHISVTKCEEFQTWDLKSCEKKAHYSTSG